jgi:hypothetical protein
MAATTASSQSTRYRRTPAASKRSRSSPRTRSDGRYAGGSGAGTHSADTHSADTHSADTHSDSGEHHDDRSGRATCGGECSAGCSSGAGPSPCSRHCANAEAGRSSRCRPTRRGTDALMQTGWRRNSGPPNRMQRMRVLRRQRRRISLHRPPPCRLRPRLRPLPRLSRRRQRHKPLSQQRPPLRRLRRQPARPPLPNPRRLPRPRGLLTPSHESDGWRRCRGTTTPPGARPPKRRRHRRQPTTNDPPVLLPPRKKRWRRSRRASLTGRRSRPRSARGSQRSRRRT